MPEIEDRMFTVADIDRRSFNDEEQSFTAFASKEVLDRHGTVILTEAWDLANYRKNPVVMWAHLYDIPPVAKAMWIRKTKEGLKFKPSFADTDMGKEIYNLYKTDILKAFSVGFRPYDWVYTDDEEDEDEGDYESLGEEGGRRKKSLFQLDRLLREHAMDTRRKKEKPWLTYTDVELMEVSCVPIPSCPEALIEEYKAGRIKTRALNDAIALQINAKEDSMEKLSLDEIYLIRPFANEHSCRLEDPGKYDEFARSNCHVEHDDKCIDYIFGIKDDTSELQSMRYPKDIWTEASARTHCEDHEGRFEAATEEESAEVIEGLIDELEEEIDEKTLEEVFNRVGKQLENTLRQIKKKKEDDNEDIPPSPDIKLRLAKGEII